MYESDLKDKKQKLGNIKFVINSTIIDYKGKLNELNKFYNQINGFAEKEIEKALANYEDNFDTSFRVFKNNVQKIIDPYLKEITEKESDSLKYIEECKEKALDDFNEKLESLFVVDKEL